MKLFNLRKQKDFRQKLRLDLSEPEKRLWIRLQGKQLNGYKFRRQHGIGPYVVDFYCSSEKFVVEIDGDSHFDSASEAYDRERDAFMRTEGITIIRLTNNDFMENLDGVLETISRHLSGNPL